MKPGIDPKVDCVFKAILGSEEHKRLLVHFLNAVLHPAPDRRIQDVEILNPYNEREFETDKLSVVDVKAKDAEGRVYQIEIQLELHPGFPARMLYTWSTIYHSLIGKGRDFTELKPVIAIWLVDESLFAGRNAWHLPFAVLNREYGVILSDHLQIHLLQLPEWQAQEGRRDAELDRWMYLFKEGVMLDVEHPPILLQTEEMQEAMQVLQHFSDNERAYLVYQQRLEAEQVELSWKNQMARLENKAEQAQQREAQERQAKEQAIARETQERRDKEQAIEREAQERREKEHLLQILKQAGIDLAQTNRKEH